MSFPKSGEVYWVRIPNQPSDPHQPRTAIIVSMNERNKHLSDVIVVPTTSMTTRPLLDAHVLIPAGEGGLKKSSVARCDQVTTIDKSLLESGPLGGQISETLLEKIIRAIRAAIDDPEL